MRLIVANKHHPGEAYLLRWLRRKDLLSNSGRRKRLPPVFITVPAQRLASKPATAGRSDFRPGYDQMNLPF